MKEFKINEYITLKLEDGSTTIYVEDVVFDQCKFLLLEIPIKEMTSLDKIDSIDEAADKLDGSMEGEIGEHNIPPETEFWGHCSNLQVWSENNYDTRLLHSNLAFPLLKKLTEVGDPKAKRVFKEEITKRIEYYYSPVVIYLLSQGYIDNFTIEEIKALNINHENAEIMYNLAKLFNKKGGYDEAIECYQKAIIIKPQYKEAWVSLGLVFHHIGKFTKAIECYETIIMIYPSYSNAWCNMGLANNHMGDYVRAIECYNKALEIDPMDEVVWYNLGVIYTEKNNNNNKAIECYKKALEIKPDYVKAWNNLAHHYINIKESNKAIECCKEAIAINSSDPDPWINLGNAHFYKEEYNKANECYNKSIDLDPNIGLSWFNKACVESVIKDFKNALIFLKKAIELDKQCKIDAQSEPAFDNIKILKEFKELIK